MTTSWAHFFRGHWRQSIESNPGGFVLALQAAATIPVLFIRAFQQSPLAKPFWVVTTLTLLFAFTAAFIDWTLRLIR
jgi:hypothetical protein